MTCTRIWSDKYRGCLPYMRESAAAHQWQRHEEHEPAQHQPPPQAAGQRCGELTFTYWTCVQLGLLSTFPGDKQVCCALLRESGRWVCPVWASVRVPSFFVPQTRITSRSCQEVCEQRRFFWETGSMWLEISCPLFFFFSSLVVDFIWLFGLREKWQHSVASHQQHPILLLCIGK